MLNQYLDTFRILSLSERESAWRVLQKESGRRKLLIEFKLNESDLNLLRRLRKAINNDVKEDYIRTVRSAGYSFGY